MVIQDKLTLYSLGVLSYVMTADEKNNTEEIKVLYEQLKASLSQLPLQNSTRPDLNVIRTQPTWERHNAIVSRLMELTGDDYLEFKIEGKNSQLGYFINLADLRQLQGELIAVIRTKYIPEEEAPFTGTPDTAININNSQSQTMHVQMLLDFGSLIEKKLTDLDPEQEKERTFLEKIKESLAQINDTNQLIQTILKTAREVGLTLAKLTTLLQ